MITKIQDYTNIKIVKCQYKKSKRREKLGRDKYFTDINALLADVQKSINKSLQNEVMDAVRDVELSHIERDVLNVYTPSIYKRRASGGIDDVKNIVGTVKDGKLTVDNVTPFNEDYDTSNRGTGLGYMINEGGNSEHDYDYGFRGIEAPYSKPRPFIDNTVEELDKTEIIEDALAKGMSKDGIDLYK